jgi:hypothetical protein
LGSVIKLDMKIRTYKAIIRPIILYGSETWTVTGIMASTLMPWERKDFQENLWIEKRTRGMENRN